jgi:hypothetical protein
MWILQLKKSDEWVDLDAYNTFVSAMHDFERLGRTLGVRIGKKKWNWRTWQWDYTTVLSNR